MRKLINILLAAALVGCVIWAAVAPKMQAIIPLILAIIAGEALAVLNSDDIKTFKTIKK